MQRRYLSDDIESPANGYNAYALIFANRKASVIACYRQVRLRSERRTYNNIVVWIGRHTGQGETASLPRRTQYTNRQPRNPKLESVCRLTQPFQKASLHHPL